MTARINYATLPTEANNKRSRNIDRVSIRRCLGIINAEDAGVANAVRTQFPALERAVSAIVYAVKSGGRLFFFGAGTSGRLGVLEAAECPPTFNTPPSLVQAFMAGGRMSVFRSKEGAEDRGADAARIVKNKVRSNDIVVGVAASGVTAYVREALKAAKKIGANTILVTCHSGKLDSPAAHTIAVPSGPEVIEGSTRLKAGTATKLVLNSLTVASMIQLGKVYGNRMVDLQPKSAKLRARAERLVCDLGGVSPARARLLLRKAGGNAKTAILMAKKKLSRDEAIKRLDIARGHLHAALA